MQYSKHGNTIFCRIEKGEEITAALLKLAEIENIGAAGVSGIGATDNFTAGIFDTSKHCYNEVHFTGDHEITSLTGSLTRMNQKPYQHLHITCAGADGAVKGGHLLSATVSLTAEIIVTVLEGEVTRKRNEELGINLIEP